MIKTLGLVAPEFQPLPASAFEDCLLFDSACVMRNVEKANQNLANFSRAVADYNREQCKENARLNRQDESVCDQLWPAGWTGSTPAVNTPIAPFLANTNTPPPANTNTPRIQFVNLTTGNANELHPGDKWKVTVTGGAPNAQVVSIGGRNGETHSTPMGATDANGNWTLTGQAEAADAGTWSQRWTVAGVNAGEFSFLLVVPTPTPKPKPKPTTTQHPPEPDTSSADQSSTEGLNFNSIPWWAWAVGAVLLMGGSR